MAKPSRRFAWIGRVVVILTLIVGVVVARRLWPEQPLRIRAAAVSAGKVRDVVSSATAGEVAPENRATLRAELGGQVVAVSKRRGDRVSKSELVVRIDPTDLEVKLRQAQAAVSTAEAQVQQAAARVETIKRQSDRAQKLLAGGAGTAQVSEDAAAALLEASRALQTASSQREQAQAQLLAARVARSKADLGAPFDGLLTDVHVQLGDSVAPGAPVLQIIDDSRLHVDATIDEADVARVRPGQSAELHLDALPERNIAGKVVRTDPSVKRDLKGARTLTVEVEVTDLGLARAAGLLPGMSANVEILVAEKSGVLTVASNHIVGRGLNRFVYALVPEGRYHRVRKRPIEVGISNWERSEVVKGVVAGELVAASLNEKGLDDGVLVQVVSVESGKEPR
ncbi:MAG: efflux RND transporter periplasmic adaptor subunit [Deltaproteobacteria bacterium]|nr:efflux RND transporter periplasmic adaptor subunit [Deltaproteobacteria bacterium]